ncbi:MAG: DUF2934 domain-containing protein [Candidatus Schekmanbacteria bacterium]|nr:DUF2934 domain-containing protein [Candidatus Schekmanbacteria bacterium]
MATTKTKTKTKAETTVKKPAAKRGRKPKTQVSDEEFRAMVQQKAYELFENRGNSGGSDLEDWITAEKMIKEQLGIK